jgi:4a-hydroxytetrahydrobiopterin dehydratase
MDKLEAVDIEQRMEAFPEWSVSGETLQRTLNFDDFVAAMAFVNRLANLAESHQHHPDIMIRYNKVTLTISTHEAGGLTEKDFTLAADTDASVATA